MKLQGHLIKCESGVLLFDLEGFTPDLEIDKKYNIDIKPYKTSRSLDQNRLMWAIIQQIAEETQNEPMDIYIAGLEHANAKCVWMAGLENTENELKKNFRAVKAYGTIMTEDNIELIRYKCFIGSSKFDSKEMAVLINYFISKAYEYGIIIESEE